MFGFEILSCNRSGDDDFCRWSGTSSVSSENSGVLVDGFAPMDPKFLNHAPWKRGLPPLFVLLGDSVVACESAACVFEARPAMNL